MIPGDRSHHSRVELQATLSSDINFTPAALPTVVERSLDYVVSAHTAAHDTEYDFHTTPSP
jgi:hypothetical protein